LNRKALFIAKKKGRVFFNTWIGSPGKIRTSAFLLGINVKELMEIPEDGSRVILFF